MTTVQDPCRQSLSSLFERCLAAQYIDVENSASYALEREGDHLHLLFQWSRGKNDWENNLDFPARPYRDMGKTWYCHRGFLRVWRSVRPYLHDAVHDPSVNCITVTGYSHGAALAALAHEYVWFERPDLRGGGIRGFGFGAPRVYWGLCMDPDLRQRWLDFTVVRNGKDIVTYLPPIILGYRHVGRILQIGHSQDGITDHRPESYKDALHEYESRCCHYFA